MRASHTRLKFYICVAVFLLMQCPVFAQEPNEVDQFVAQWLVSACELGDEGVLIEKVGALGPAGIRALIAAHENGPPPEVQASIEEAARKRSRQRRHVLEDTDLLQIEAEELTILQSESEDEFVERQVNSFIEGYKSQALNGLRLLGGKDAKAYVESL